MKAPLTFPEVYDVKISVIGAGAQGSATAFILTKISDAQVVSADIDLNVAKKAAEKINSDKVTAERVDAGNVDDLVRVISGSDVVVNAVVGRFNFPILDAALKSGVQYVDLAGDVPCIDFVPKELAYDVKFKDAGLTAIVFTGGPFVTNSAVRYVADRLDRVDEIRLKQGFARGEGEEVPTFSPGWCPEMALMEWVRPMVYENGKWKDVPQFSGLEEYPFPEPLGPQTISHVDFEPVHTLPHFIKDVKYVEMKQGPDRMAFTMIKQGFASYKPIDVKGVKVAPIDVLLALTPPATETRDKRTKEMERRKMEPRGCSLAEVKGEKNGEKITHTIYRVFNSRADNEKWGTPGVSVGLPAAITALMLAKKEIKEKGVIPPEGLNPNLYLGRMAEKGWIFHEKITREVHP